jgi:hypothetical protein
MDNMLFIGLNANHMKPNIPFLFSHTRGCTGIMYLFSEEGEKNS